MIAIRVLLFAAGPDCAQSDGANANEHKKITTRRKRGRNDQSGFIMSISRDAATNQPLRARKDSVSLFKLTR